MGFGTELVADEYVLVLLPFVINKFGKESEYNSCKKVYKITNNN